MNPLDKQYYELTHEPLGLMPYPDAELSGRQGILLADQRSEQSAWHLPPAATVDSVQKHYEAQARQHGMTPAPVPAFSDVQHHLRFVKGRTNPPTQLLVTVIQATPRSLVRLQYSSPTSAPTSP